MVCDGDANVKQPKYMSVKLLVMGQVQVEFGMGLGWVGFGLSFGRVGLSLGWVWVEFGTSLG